MKDQNGWHEQYIPGFIILDGPPSKEQAARGTIMIPGGKTLALKQDLAEKWYIENKNTP